MRIHQIVRRGDI